MMHKVDFSSASSEAIIEALGKRLEEIRLSRNIPQATLAREAGVSRSTLTRLADGQPVSLDSFVRIMQALALGDHLASLLPDPAIRPVDRVRLAGGGSSDGWRSSAPQASPRTPVGCLAEASSAALTTGWKIARPRSLPGGGLMYLASHSGLALPGRRADHPSGAVLPTKDLRATGFLAG